jgi:hypothetical protein
VSTSKPRLLLLVAAAMLTASVVVLIRDPQTEQKLSHDRDTSRVPDLGAILDAFAGALPVAGPYRAPSPAERTKFLAGLATLAADDIAEATEELRPLGFMVRAGTDPDTGRPYALATNEPRSYRSWGHYLVDLSAPAALLVEVPHPTNDLHTDRLGLALYRAVPGSVLAVSGTNRWAAAGAGDVAHRTDSLFHAVAVDYAARGLPQVQLHGFHDATLPDADVVVSPGVGAVGDPVRRAADRLSDAGFTVCRSWLGDCGRLEGTRNEQGIDAAARHTVFLHVEVSRSVRDDPARWTILASALASADLTGR